MSLKNQLRIILKKTLNYILKYKERAHHLIDIIDSQYYKKLASKGFINLLIVTDGIELCKSSSEHFWPVILQIIELPFTMRQSISNQILFGVWHGSKKPSSEILFSFLGDEVNHIYQNGLYVDLDEYQQAIYVSLYGLGADSVAKTHILDMLGHNGHFGCHYCVVDCRN